MENGNGGRRPTRPFSALLWVLGLALAILGQTIFSVARDRSVFGLAAFAAAVLVLLAAARPDAPGERRLGPRIARGLADWVLRIDSIKALQVFLSVVAVVSVLITLVIEQRELGGDAYWPAFYAWIAAVLALATAFVYLPMLERGVAWRATLTGARRELVLVVAITLVALVLRVVNLTSIPFPFSGDESSIGLEGQALLHGIQSNMFATGWQAEVSMSFLPWAGSMALFGESIFGLRILAALVGALTIPLLYLLVRRMFGVPLALGSAALLAVMSVHIHFSRIAVNNVDNPFFACLVFWLVYTAVETRRLEAFGAAGLAAGLAVYTFVGSRLVVMLAVVYLLYAWARDRTLRGEWPQLAALGFTAGLIMLPIGIYFLQHPADAMARLNQIGLFQSGWLAHTTLDTGVSTSAILARQAADAFLVLVATPATHGFYNSPGPLLESAWAFFFLLGLGFSLARVRERRHFLLQLWFWPVLLFGSVLLVPPPFAERLSMAFPAIAFFVAFGLWEVVHVGVRALGVRPVAAGGTMALAGLVLAATSVGFYFFDYTPQHYYTDPNTEVGMELGLYLATAPRDARVYFLGEPRMFYDFPSIPFLSGQLDGINVPSGADVRPLVEPGPPAIFVALPGREQEMDQIRQIFPGGTFSKVDRPTQPSEVLYLLYTVSVQASY